MKIEDYWKYLDATAGIYKFLEGIKVDANTFSDKKHILAHELSHRDLTLNTNYGIICYFLHSVLAENVSDNSDTNIKQVFGVLLNNCRDVHEAYATANQLNVIREYHGIEEENVFWRYLPPQYNVWLKMLIRIVDENIDVADRLWIIAAQAMNSNLLSISTEILLDPKKLEMYLRIPDHNPNKRFEMLVTRLNSGISWDEIKLDEIVTSYSFDAKSWDAFILDIANESSGLVKKAILDGLQIMNETWLKSYRELDYHLKIGIGFQYGVIDQFIIKKSNILDIEQRIKSAKNIIVLFHQNEIELITFINKNELYQYSGKIEDIISLIYKKPAECSISSEYWCCHGKYFDKFLQKINTTIFITITQTYIKTKEIWDSLTDNNTLLINGIYESDSVESPAILFAKMQNSRLIFCIPSNRYGIIGMINHLEKVYPSIKKISILLDFFEKTAIGMADNYFECVSNGYWDFQGKA